MELDPSTKITLAAGIMEGLLATGHYTQPNPKGSVLKDMIRRGDAGEDWEKNARCRYPAYVVDDALVLLWELNMALDAGVQPVIDALTPKKSEPKPVTVRKKKAAAKKRKKQ